MISWHGFAKCKGGLNREKDILKTIIVSGFTLFETKLFLGFERANVTSFSHNLERARVCVFARAHVKCNPAVDNAYPN